MGCDCVLPNAGADGVADAVNVALLIWLFGAKSQMELQFPPTLFETLLATSGSCDALQSGPG
jgi:hypothetical protein